MPSRRKSRAFWVTPGPRSADQRASPDLGIRPLADQRGAALIVFLPGACWQAPGIDGNGRLGIVRSGCAHAERLRDERRIGDPETSQVDGAAPRNCTSRPRDFTSAAETHQARHLAPACKTPLKQAAAHVGNAVAMPRSSTPGPRGEIPRISDARLICSCATRLLQPPAVRGTANTHGSGLVVLLSDRPKMFRANGIKNKFSAQHLKIGAAVDLVRLYLTPALWRMRLQQESPLSGDRRNVSPLSPRCQEDPHQARQRSGLQRALSSGAQPPVYRSSPASTGEYPAHRSTGNRTTARLPTGASKAASTAIEGSRRPTNRCPAFLPSAT